MPTKTILNGIMLNEEQRMPRCYNSMIHCVDAACWTDTGSTDKSIDIVYQLGRQHNIPSKVYQDKWVDFSHNRTSSLRHMEQYLFEELDPIPIEPMTEKEWNGKVNTWYVLFMDSDNVLCAGDPNKAKGGVDKPGKEFKLDKDSLKEPRLVIDMTCGPTIYDYCWGHELDRAGECLFIWSQPLHEYVTSDGWSCNTQRVPGGYIISGRDGARSQQSQSLKYNNDLVMFENFLLREPRNARGWFYAGQSARDCQNWKKCYDYYLERTAMKGWHEEVYKSHLECYNVLLTQLDTKNTEKQLYHVLQAYETYPERFEATYFYIKYLADKGHYKAAWNFARAHVFSNPPHPVLFGDGPIINWRFYLLTAEVAFDSGEKSASQKILRKIIDAPGLPEEEKNHIREMLKRC